MQIIGDKKVPFSHFKKTKVRQYSTNEIHQINYLVPTQKNWSNIYMSILPMWIAMALDWQG